MPARAFHGYASDITRTHAGADASEFAALIDAVDAAQQGFCAKVRAGQSYPELHIHAHHVLAGILRDQGFIRMSAESAVESGVSSAFFPHGLGHGIGLQVHDVAGFHASENGDTIRETARTSVPAPDAHARTRHGHDDRARPLLHRHAAGRAETQAGARDVDWDKVDAFRKYGGIRIEDDVVCTDGEPENLTRDAFAIVG